MEPIMLVMPAFLFALLVFIISIQISEPLLTFFVDCLAAFFPITIFLLLVIVVICRELRA
jgi:hypothetical protein